MGGPKGVKGQQEWGRGSIERKGQEGGVGGTAGGVAASAGGGGRGGVRRRCIGLQLWLLPLIPVI